MDGSLVGCFPFCKWETSHVFAWDAYGKTPRMSKKTWSDRLSEAAEAFPGGRKGLSVKAGLNETFLRDTLKRGTMPGIEKFLAICRAAHVDPFFILYGDNAPKFTIPVLGIVSAGEGWSNQDGATFEPIEFEIEKDDIVSIEVRGDSMAPVYRSGDHLICQRHQRGFDNLIGLDCAVLTADGQGYVKILKRGTRPNRFNLKSYNVANEDIENVQLAWAAPVIWIKRGRS